VVERVPYLKELGVDMIWLSPCYESPRPRRIWGMIYPSGY
jgi:glycosidase